MCTGTCLRPALQVILTTGVVILEPVTCRYVVLNRPYAFVQWLQGANITEKYIFMSEPDHIWLKPMPNPIIGQRPAAFPFFYIEPSKKEFLPITQKFTGPLTQKQAEAIPPIGMYLHTAPSPSRSEYPTPSFCAA